MISSVPYFTPDSQRQMFCTHCKKELVAFCISIPNIDNPLKGPVYALEVLHAASAAAQINEMKDLGIRYYQVGKDRLPVGMGRIARQIDLLAKRLHKTD